MIKVILGVALLATGAWAMDVQRWGMDVQEIQSRLAAGGDNAWMLNLTVQNLRDLQDALSQEDFEKLMRDHRRQACGSCKCG